MVTAAKAKRKPAKPVDLAVLGARVVSVFGPFGASTMIVMPTVAAEELFPDGLVAAKRTAVIEAAERDVESIRDRDADLADSALAASAVALAYEIEHPYNSATSKSMCAREMRDTLDRLRELAPEREQVADELDELAKERARRRAGSAAG